MGNKKYLPFPFKSSSSQTPSSWPWPNPCTATPKTLSFRAPQHIFNTTNSAFLDPINPNEFIGAPEIFLEEEEDSLETLIRGLSSSERLLFDQPDETSSILESVVNDQNNRVQSTECFAISVESTDPLVDFKKSMEEMVEAHDLKDWDCLEELLGCYLKVNNKSNHGYIVGAFVELLVGLGFSSSSSSSTSNNNSFRSHSLDFIQCSSSTTHSFTSPMESYTSSSSSNSPCVSSLLDVDDDVEKPATVNVVTSS